MSPTVRVENNNSGSSRAVVHGRDNKAGEITEFDSFIYAQGGTKVSLSFIICGEKNTLVLKERREGGREG